MSGSDFFYPISSSSPSDQHQYDNLIYPSSLLNDCPHCHQTNPRSSLRDISCQVPSLDDDDYGKRSSPLYSSPRSSPITCQPPLARTLLAPYHSHRPSSISSSHSRSKSAPSSRSKGERRDSPVHETTVSTTTLLRSIKTSIDAMKKRLKDIRRVSEVGTFYSVLMTTMPRRNQESEREKEEKITSVAFALSVFFSSSLKPFDDDGRRRKKDEDRCTHRETPVCRSIMFHYLRAYHHSKVEKDLFFLSIVSVKMNIITSFSFTFDQYPSIS